MAKKTKKTLALVLALVLCFSLANITVYAAPWGNNQTQKNWTYAYYLGQEYLGNAAGKAVKPDPVGYGFQGVITSITFEDDNGKTWTFQWNYEANGEWRITGKNVSKEDAAAFPAVTDGGRYIGYCGNKAYEFTLSLDGKADGWTYVNDSSRHANWFYYIRFIREYIVNVYYENPTGNISYNGITYAAQEPLVREFEFLYPNGNIIDDSEYEDGEYTDPVKLLPGDYLTNAMKAQGYEIKYATDAKGKDVLTSGVTISLLGDNILNVYCTLIPPATEDYTIIHEYNTEDKPDGTVHGGKVEVEEGAEFDKVVDTLDKIPTYNGKEYTYSGYEVDPENNVITLIYDREIPVYDVIHEYNTDGETDAVIPGDPVQTEDPEKEIDDIEKIPTYDGEEYTYVGYEIDEEEGTITIIYDRELPQYNVIHVYYTEGREDAAIPSYPVKTDDPQNAVESIRKIPVFNGNTYTYVDYEIDEENRVIFINYNRELPKPEVTEPEVTEPEVTEPEVTEPEVTEPEVTEPEVTEPEVTEPEVTEPEVTEPEVTEPEVTEPEVTEPEVTEPEVTEPEVTEPEVTEPEVTEPEVTEPEVTEPEVTEPEVTEPEVTEPEVTEPEVTEPEVTEPEVTEPEVTEPEVTEPDPTDPDGDDPLVDIPDEDVPLAEIPKTGDPMILYSALTVLSGAGLAVLGIRKKEE